MAGNRVQHKAPDGRPSSEQPLWRQEFPIATDQDDRLARRDFTRFMGLTSLAFVVGQFCIGVMSWLRSRNGPPPAREIASLEPGHPSLPYLPPGGALMFDYPGAEDNCLLLRPEADRVVAYDQKCTHLSCAVVPAIEAGCLNCPCHRGRFDLETGRPLAGPPRRPLPRVVLEVDRASGIVRAVGVELRTG
jgi:nitrite reductase/ring-hydroxylating ferredoxin subunit